MMCLMIFLGPILFYDFFMFFFGKCYFFVKTSLLLIVFMIFPDFSYFLPNFTEKIENLF